MEANKIEHLWRDLPIFAEAIEHFFDVGFGQTNTRCSIQRILGQLILMDEAGATDRLRDGY